MGTGLWVGNVCAVIYAKVLLGRRGNHPSVHEPLAARTQGRQMNTDEHEWEVRFGLLDLSGVGSKSGGGGFGFARSMTVFDANVTVETIAVA